MLSTISVDAGAQTLGEPDVVQRARDLAPAVRVAEVSARIAEASIENEGLWPNPWVSYQRQQTFDPQAEAQDTVLLTLPLAFGGRRDAERGLARAAHARAEGVRDTTRSDAVGAALELFYRSLAAERRVQIERTMREQLGEAQRVLSSREAVGETSGYASARLTLESELAQSRLEEAIVIQQALRAQLAGALGMTEPGALPPLGGTFDVSAPSPVAALTSQALDRRVELSATRRTEAVASEARGAASIAWIPDLSLSAGYQNVSEAGLGHGFNVQLSVELPFFDHGQGLLAQATAAANGASERSDALRGLVASEVAASHARLAGMLTERVRFTRETAPHVELLLRSAGSGFAGGERTLVELIDAQRAAVDVARRRLFLDLAVRLADVSLRRATGAFR